MNAPLVYPRLTPTQLVERWRELLDQPGLPHLFELDEYGELIEMIPPKLPHQRIVASLVKQLESALGGEALPGLGVLTAIGVRIPDVVWQRQFYDAEADPVRTAPAICVEVLSPDNFRREIDQKTVAYLEAGAHEVIVVETSGRIRFFGPDGERPDSAFGLKLILPPGTYPLRQEP